MKITRPSSLLRVVSYLLLRTVKEFEIAFLISFVIKWAVEAAIAVGVALGIAHAVSYLQCSLRIRHVANEMAASLVFAYPIVTKK